MYLYEVPRHIYTYVGMYVYQVPRLYARDAHQVGPPVAVCAHAPESVALGTDATQIQYTHYRDLCISKF